MHRLLADNLEITCWPDRCAWLAGDVMGVLKAAFGFHQHHIGEKP